MIITFARCGKALATATSCCSPGLSDRTGRSVAIRKPICASSALPSAWSL